MASIPCVIYLFELPYSTNDGQTKIVREGDNGVAYSWNSRDQKWDKIGEVVDGPEDNVNRAVLDGITRTLLLISGFSRRIFRFLIAKQVVEFILQNSGQKDFALDTSYRDPYTGSSAYIPGETSNLSGVLKKPTFKHIPKKGMLFFEVAQFDGILKKISEFNNSLLSEVGQNSVSLTELDLSRLAAIVKILKDTSHYHSTTFGRYRHCFIVIDILRMVVLHPDGASSLAKHIEDGNDMLLETFKKATEEPALPGNLLTITRLMTKYLQESIFSSMILDALSCCCSSSNKNVNLSYSTLVLNYAVLLIEKRDQEGQAQVLSAALEMLEGLVKSIAIDFDVRSIAKGAKASKEVKIAEVGADIELLINAA
ncbi:phospholipase A-2-activating protein isoform X1 [Cinnamomum micranthum f. kanehirae]|uniref:Phospholipase A-2-activating protein isoform X1 n=1 Tax=Cinnamomum micranthum f. kanehirae TaxID=337451 RepID=A0A3S4N3I8_9MAGN|nr:phospholipase A-2-activating protein isoform X1 [Cinnamomum micranthum f. kanehirae]